MYDLILIDDDAAALNTLAEIFPWNELNFKLAGAFSNSSAAVEFIGKNHIDVIITDIAMPSPSGLEIIKMCDLNYPSVKIILLSAYRDFEYARSAIRCSNVVEYFTKPLDVTQLYNVLKKLSGELSSQEKTYFSSEYEYNQRLSFFSNLVCGYLKNEDELIDGLIKLKLDKTLASYPCSLVNFHITNFPQYIEKLWKHSTAQLYHAISNVVPFETDDGYFSMANFSFGNISWFIIHKSSQDVFSTMTSFSNSLIENLKSCMKMNIDKSSYRTWLSLNEVLKSPKLNYFEEFNSEDVISSAIRFVEENYSKDISLKDVAEHVYMCPVYFSSFFKKNTGENFITKITSIRLEHAAELLLTTNMTISEIKEAVGYNHTGNFYKQFKKHFNMTPNEYKNNFFEKQIRTD